MSRNFYVDGDGLSEPLVSRSMRISGDGGGDPLTQAPAWTLQSQYEEANKLMYAFDIKRFLVQSPDVSALFNAARREMEKIEDQYALGRMWRQAPR